MLISSSVQARIPSDDPSPDATPRWKDQCQAARRIQEAFGVQRALAYLVGEKLFGALRELERDRSLSADVEAFAAEVRAIFDRAVLRQYLLSALCRKHPGPPSDRLVYAPEEALFLQQLKTLLLTVQRHPVFRVKATPSVPHPTSGKKVLLTAT